jgi:hypothetical protein
VILALSLTVGPAAALAALALIARRLDRAERAVLLAASAVFALSALLSPVSYVHDHFTHFRHARGAWENPEQLLDLWDRPAFMLLYAGPARLGLVAARLASLLPAGVAIGATMLAARAARLPRPWLAGILLASQYDFFGQASSTMTELLLAAGLAVACWGFLEERPWLAAAGLAFCGVTRPEAPLVVAAGTLVLAARYRRPLLALAVAAPFVAYIVAGSAVHGDLLWLVHGNPYRDTVELRLEAGQVVRSFFYEALGESQPLPLILLEAAGVALVLREGRHRATFLLGPVAALWLLCTFLRIGPHDWWRQSRYLVSIAPVLALLAARAHAALGERFPRVAHTTLLTAAACAAAAMLAKTWRPAVAPGSPVIPALFAVAMAAAAAAWLARRRVPAPAALAALLVAPLVLSPPGAFAHHLPTPSERAAEELVGVLAARRVSAIAVDHGSLEPVCAKLIGDPGRPCPLPLQARSAPGPDDTLFVKQHDGTWTPPSPPEGWREAWRSAGPRIEGPLRAPVTWTTTTLLWERERHASAAPQADATRSGAAGARDR